MKITFCLYDRPGYVGGPNVGLCRLLPDLQNRGLDVQCLVLHFGTPEECPTIQSLQHSGIACCYASYQVTTQQRVRWLLRMIRKQPCDVFVPNLMPAAYFAAAYLKKYGIPSIGVLRSDDVFHHRLVELFIRGREKDRIVNWVTVSAYLKSTILNEGLRVVEQIPSSINFSSSPAQFEGGCFRLLYSGRLVERQKRISLVAETFCIVTSQLNNVKATILGDGPDRKNVERIISRYPEASVTLAGRIDCGSVPNVLAAHHAIILLSEYEGMPLALLEGMSAGLVPMGTFIRSGIPELIRPNETGFLLDDPAASLMNAVRELQVNPKRFSTLSTNSRALVVAKFSRAHCADKWVGLLDSCAESSRRKTILYPPLHLDLPQHNGLREDDRATAANALRTVIADILPPLYNHKNTTTTFTAPCCTPCFVDRYTVRKAIVRALRETLPRMRGLVLDIGAGLGPYRNLYLDAPHVKQYVAVDLKETLYAKPDVTWDGRTLPFANEAAGVVALTEVLEHCSDPAYMLSEAARVLESSGLLFATVPFLWPLHDVPYDEFRYTPYAMKRLLENAGFSQTDIRPLGGYDAALAQMLGLYARRRSRSFLFEKVVSPILSAAFAPLVWILTALDTRPKTFREGQMITGLHIIAKKGG